MEPVVAGLVAAIPLAAVLSIYALARGRALADFFGKENKLIAQAPQGQVLAVIVACFVVMAFIFGALAGLIFGWLHLPVYNYLAFGATLLFSLLAPISKQPLPGDKIVWNLAVGLILGVLVPLLAR